MSNRQTIFQEACDRCGQNTNTYRAAFAASDDALSLLSRDRAILDANDALARLSRYSRRQLTEIPFDALFPKRSDHRHLLTRERLIRNAPLFTFQTRLRTQTREDIPVSIAISPLPGSGCTEPVFQAHISDIAGTSCAATALSRECRTSDRLRSLGDLAGGIAHNFNNILMGIYGNITLAKLEMSQASDALAHLEKAEDSMEGAVKLTRQLLTFARGGEPVKERFPPGPFVEETARFNLSGSSVRLEMKPADALWPINADKEQIGQVVGNIVINARQAMTRGGTLTIRLENTTLLKDNLLTIARGSYLKLTFKDRGPGVSESDLNRIFDPYFSTKPDGNGMGLSICHSIVTKHNGDISVASQLGSGTIVTVYLPAEPPEASKEGNMTTQGLNTKARARILVMDDEEHIRSITRKMLEKFGHAVALTKDGEEAVTEYKNAMSQEDAYDLVIMDLTVPGGKGGKEASTEILEFDPNARILVSSGYSNDPVMADYKTHGLKGIIAKPYRLTELKETVERLLR